MKTSKKILIAYLVFVVICYAVSISANILHLNAPEGRQHYTALYDRLCSTPIRVLIVEQADDVPGTENPLLRWPQSSILERHWEVDSPQIDLVDNAASIPQSIKIFFQGKGTQVEIEGDTLRIVGNVRGWSRLPHLEHYIYNGVEQTLYKYSR